MQILKRGPTMVLRIFLLFLIILRNKSDDFFTLFSHTSFIVVTHEVIMSFTLARLGGVVRDRAAT
jgi:hypothetical protein